MRMILGKRLVLLTAAALAVTLSAGAADAQQLKLPTTWDYIRGFSKAGMDAWNQAQGIRGGSRVVPGRGRIYRGPVRQGWRGYYGPYRGRYVEPGWDSDAVAPNPEPQPAPELAPNPLPGEAHTVGEIRPIDDDFENFHGGAIVNPATNGVTLNYRLNGRAHRLPPGHYQDLGVNRKWVIEFDRGGQNGKAKYSVGGVKHVFTPTERGWDLYRKSVSQ